MQMSKKDSQGSFFIDFFQMGKGRKIYICLNKILSIFDKEWSRRTIYFLLILVILGGAGLRCWRWTAESVVSRDAIFYIMLSETWYNHGFAAMHQNVLAVPPLFLWTIKSLMNLGFSGENSGVLLNLTLGSMLPLLMFFWLKALFRNAKIGLLAALLTSVHPALVKLSHEVQRETLYLFFLLLSLMALSAAVKEGKKRYFFFSGVATFCAIFSRYEALEIVLFLLICVVCLMFYEGQSWKSKLYKTLSYLTGLLFGVIVISLICGITWDYHLLWLAKTGRYFYRYME